MTLRKDCYCYLWYLKPSLFSLGMLFVSAPSPTWAVSWHQWWAALKCHKIKAVCVLVVQVKDTCWAEFTAPLAIMLLSFLSGVFSKAHSCSWWLSFIYQLYSDCSKSPSYLAKGFTRNASFILTQGSKLGLLLCRQILYHLSHREAQRLIQSSFNSFAHFCAPGFQTEPAPICGCQDCPRYFTPCIHGCPVLRSLQDAPSKAMVFIIMPSGNTSLM